MTKLYVTFTLILFAVTVTVAQTCDCKANYEWVKKTFEENDAGFQYALKVKGEQAYADHNKRIMDKVQQAKTLNECTPVLYEWLKFFRSGHIAIRLNEQAPQKKDAKATKQFTDWETYPVKTEEFKAYLDKKSAHDYEGIWETTPYKIGIKKEGEKYIGLLNQVPKPGQKDR